MGINVDEIYTSNYLKAEHLGAAGTTVKVTVNAVDVEEFTDNRTETTKRQIVMSFVGKDRRFGLNVTNKTVMADMHGKDTDGWLNKTITLTVRRELCFGEMQDCLRIVHDGTTFKPPENKPADNGNDAPGGDHKPIKEDDIPF